MLVREPQRDRSPSPAGREATLDIPGPTPLDGSCSWPGSGAAPWRRHGRPPDLSFADHGHPYATHGLHPFAAKFPPPLARWAIETFTEPGEWLLDPFAGSGTALVEARLLGRNALAAEIDPLSRLMARVKATPLDPATVTAAKEQLDRRWEDLSHTVRDGGLPAPARLPEFPNRDHWFHPRVQRDLALLRDAIAAVEDRRAREFLLVVYSSVIIAKGPSTVANALDIAHSRAHHTERSQPPDVWERFADRYRRALRGLRELHARAAPAVDTLVLGQDVWALPYRSRVADAVLSSPPYVTAIEYPRAHKFSVWWIGGLIGVPHRVHERLRAHYIGTENVHHHERATLSARASGVPAVDRITAELEGLDEVRAGRARRYFADMRAALAEMLRTLKPDRYAVLVVANTTLRGVVVPAATCLAEIAESLRVDGSRFVHRDTVTRPIRERSRQLPIKRGANPPAMQTEHVLILQRRPARRLLPTGEETGG